ncbi:tRNA (adenosine(37)-N6)-dimethylallyltransferase MiaA [Aestuariivirga sp.]|uniref:tRNA (adenosine(37)-N6)-dimethylallyltransferase MiaA n=1 Tax=Aestuariivirga sp. TaxID=2650926 RepID=UPI00391970FD
MTATSKKRALLIAGPTASGKSALALELARKRHGVVINADALQVYAPLRILTARPTGEDEAQAPHRLYGHVAAEQPYSAAAWVSEASREMAKAWEEGLLPVLTGGTGLYFRALERGLAPVPEIPEAIRGKWRSYEGDLHAELRRRDPAMAETLSPGDRQRLTRALEVVEATGRSLLDWQREGEHQAPLAGVETERIFMEVPRDELYARADARFAAMIERGALEEARGLMGLDPRLPVMKAIGLPELIAHLEGRMSIDEAIARARTATRNYIKRQLTWWRGQMAHWR